MGIKQDSHILVYDQGDWQGAPRAWTMFRSFGHDRVSILDGGLKAWIKDGYRVVSSTDQPDPMETQDHQEPDYVPEFDEHSVVEYEGMLAQLTDFLYAKQFNILDARPHELQVIFLPHLL